jgi:hypothetical protein
MLLFLPLLWPVLLLLLLLRRRPLLLLRWPLLLRLLRRMLCVGCRRPDPARGGLGDQEAQLLQDGGPSAQDAVRRGRWWRLLMLLRRLRSLQRVVVAHPSSSPTATTELSARHCQLSPPLSPLVSAPAPRV